jgi:hypothetical protein
MQRENLRQQGNKNISEPAILYLIKFLFSYEDVIKIFSGIQSIREIVLQRLTLKTLFGGYI